MLAEYCKSSGNVGKFETLQEICIRVKQPLCNTNQSLNSANQGPGAYVGVCMCVFVCVH